MALIGTDSKVILINSFDPSSGNWFTGFGSTSRGYASQGFDFPEHDADNPPDWINKPTGYNLSTGLVMAFPRSAEPGTTPPPPTNGGWQVKEA